MQIIQYFNIVALASVGLLNLVIILLLTRQKKSKAYLYFFQIFYVYLVIVGYFTLFQFQSLLLLKQLVPQLMVQGQALEQSINLIPLIMLTRGQIETSVLNVVLFVPFGVLLPFLVSYRWKKIMLIGLISSIGIELLQLLTGVLVGTTLRITDINDVLFNTVGTVIGYGVFLLFVVLLRIAIPKSKSYVWNYIAKRPQLPQKTE